MKTIKRGLASITFSEITKFTAVLLFGSAALLFSVSHANAGQTEDFNFPDELTEKSKTEIANSTGKYQMAITSVIKSDNNSTYYIIVWDSETGRNKLYYGSTSSKKVQAAYSAYQLPSNPL